MDFQTKKRYIPVLQIRPHLPTPSPFWEKGNRIEGEKPPKKSRVNSDGHPDNTGKTMWEMGKTILLFQLLYAKGSD